MAFSLQDNAFFVPRLIFLKLEIFIQRCFDMSRDDRNRLEAVAARNVFSGKRNEYMAPTKEYSVIRKWLSLPAWYLLRHPYTHSWTTTPATIVNASATKTVS